MTFKGVAILSYIIINAIVVGWVWYKMNPYERSIYWSCRHAMEINWVDSVFTGTLFWGVFMAFYSFGD